MHSRLRRLSSGCRRQCRQHRRQIAKHYCDSCARRCPGRMAVRSCRPLPSSGGYCRCGLRVPQPPRPIQLHMLSTRGQTKELLRCLHRSIEGLLGRPGPGKGRRGGALRGPGEWAQRGSCHRMLPSSRSPPDSAPCPGAQRFYPPSGSTRLRRVEPPQQGGPGHPLPCRGRVCAVLPGSSLRFQLLLPPQVEPLQQGGPGVIGPDVVPLLLPCRLRCICQARIAGVLVHHALHLIPVPWHSYMASTTKVSCLPFWGRLLRLKRLKKWREPCSQLTCPQPAPPDLPQVGLHGLYALRRDGPQDLWYSSYIRMSYSNGEGLHVHQVAESHLNAVLDDDWDAAGQHRIVKAGGEAVACSAWEGLGIRVCMESCHSLQCMQARVATACLSAAWGREGGPAVACGQPR